MGCLSLVFLISFQQIGMTKSLQIFDKIKTKKSKEINFLGKGFKKDYLPLFELPLRDCLELE
jgi:hypothetical protein